MTGVEINAIQSVPVVNCDVTDVSEQLLIFTISLVSQHSRFGGFIHFLAINTRNCCLDVYKLKTGFDL